ncbi:hypothetical protein [Dyadobacter psychrotolerans]|uniref:Uncharacterized protein n=1 Tax=Dyadobacter psychrotolerans TaxID=2541721 RepID=A0A4R5E0U2_9BACT|nr:hypothetical protein [Dyadobacter psychrotolerans]TDE18550.1 hypothetical protein E0F88_03155 [Dyadobacter psychrotolerans]
MKQTLPPAIKSGFLKAATVLFAVLAVLAVQSCSTSDTDPIDPYDYYPVQLGQYKIYQVDEDVYSTGSRVPVTKKWQEKDEVTSVSEDASGNKTYIFSRSTRNTAAQSWQKIKEFSVQHFADRVVVNLDNEVFLPLVFPYNSTINWDGYQYFNMDDQDPRYGSEHHYENINQALTVNNLNFDKTIKVSERSDTTGQAQFRLGFKVYASGVGLVADEQTDFDYLQENGEFIGYRTIGSGTRRIKRIIESGVLE